MYICGCNPKFIVRGICPLFAFRWETPFLKVQFTKFDIE